LSKSGIASRRESDALIQMGTTEINGLLCLDPAYQVKKTDIVLYDGKKIKPEINKIVLMLNKPPKIITTVKDTHGRRTVLDIIETRSRVVPIGRLDQDTTGLLLLTNDGDLHQHLTHPKNSIPKDYELEIEGRINDVQVKKITRGVYIGDKEYGRAEVLDQETKKGRSKLILRLRHGKKREIRRLMYRVKVKLFNLRRTNYAGLKLGSLKEGEYRKLTDNEIKKLWDAG
ncbi:MAG: rRNA pseudouridine synthase, partial [Candidatus Marinimicrobia bacterium]|nr:rRNA pseudouridine synthase [Candidatus Neomarinimicrobiota bacterium]